MSSGAKPLLSTASRTPAPGRGSKASRGLKACAARALCTLATASSQRPEALCAPGGFCGPVRTSSSSAQLLGLNPASPPALPLAFPLCPRCCLQTSSAHSRFPGPRLQPFSCPWVPSSAGLCTLPSYSGAFWSSLGSSHTEVLIPVRHAVCGSCWALDPTQQALSGLLAQPNLPGRP